jgi:hypothetical protein
MTKEEILAMKPGSELNIAVAERIMGHIVKKDEIMGYMERTTNPKTKEDNCDCCSSCSSPQEGDSIWGFVEPYSEDISVAKQVIDKMTDIGYEDAKSWPDFGDGKYTEAEAICKAALLAVL